MSNSDVITVPELKNIRSDFYSNQIHAIEDFAEITSCTDIMNQYIDQYDTFRAILGLRKVTGLTDSAKHAAEALIASTEVSIFSIAKGIIKAIYNIAKFFLHILGKIIRFVFSFFKHNNEDTKKDLEKIANKINLIQHDEINSGIRSAELKTLVEIIHEHASALGTSPHPDSPGMTIEAYKKIYYNEFNNSVKSFAKVFPQSGDIQTPVYINARGTVGKLGWVSYDKLVNGIDELDSAEKRITEVLKTLKSQSREVKHLVEECEANGFVANKYIEAKSPEAINAACFTTVLVKDLKKLKAAEDRFGDMASEMEKHAKRYVATA